MFLGTYSTKFNGLNRVVLPKKFRQSLGADQEIILTLGMDPCIWAFNVEEWNKQAEKQLEIPINEKQGRDVRRQFFAQAENCELDLQGRFVIPPGLVEFAGLEGEVLLIGAGDHLEIWNPKVWSEFSKTDE